MAVGADAKELAVKLASTAGISAVDAYSVTESYIQRLSDVGALELDDETKWHGLMRWYGKECLALPAVAIQLIELAQADEADVATEWINLGVEEEGQWLNADDHVQELFKGWASLAQRPLTVAQHGSDALFW